MGGKNCTEHNIVYRQSGQEVQFESSSHSATFVLGDRKVAVKPRT